MKTPEQMAEDWVLGRWYAVHDPTISGESKVAFLAGYKAGQEHPFQFQTKMWVDPIGPQDRWISVKERLPEINQEVLISYGKKPFLLIAFLYHPQYPKKDVKVFCGTNNTNYSLEYVTHWMPLPAAPKE